MSEPLIDLAGVTRQYQRGGETLRVLDDLDFSMPKGAFYAMMGPSGSGKTTLLNLLGGLDRADGGQVLVGGEDLAQMDGPELAAWRSVHVGFVFQGFNLIPVLNAIENLELALLLTPLSKRDRRQHAEHALELVGLKDRMKHKPKELSGGQEQRVAIARAIVTDPELILADEPTGDLDRTSALQILGLLQKLNTELDKTILMVTHDPVAAEHAHCTAHLDKGKLGRIEQNAAGRATADAALAE
ncbi:MAG: ABC transporter ATP-binding protein [Planctomycetota bacterium]